MPSDDLKLVFITTITCLILYYLLLTIYKNSQIPLLVSVFIFSNMVSRTEIFKNLVNTVKTATTAQPYIPDTAANGVFQTLSEFQKIELLTAMQSLKNYESASKVQVDRRKRLFKLMTWRQQKVCEQVGYLDKLSKVNSAIVANSKFINDVADHCIQKYGITYKDFDMVKEGTQGASATNYRVIEALSHYVRDWSSLDRLSDELQPIFNYINKQLSGIIPEEEKSSTCIIVPGSGLGRIAHEIGKLGYGSVHSVEYSGLMTSFVDFNYNSSTEHIYNVHPYIHQNSNFYSTESQLRSIKLSSPLCPKPYSLHLHNSDFLEFSIPEVEKYTNVVVVSVYFLDTAENLMDYLDTIQRLTTNKPIKTGYWINVGPLKYGTAAQVELNAHELKAIRQKTGWVDIDYVDSLTSPSSIGNDTGLLGYITDTESMWQGYYALNMFTSKRQENK
ncbi:uncharacterized protein SPAPADRAFT_142865 [Spathaspora passalidarum NRRL Y-27907]|uniref:Uncharacterized protein n=1 Tax=Spathaspora passalidarum (strain NRRL Y-27907 / 11-Y1) TaxID=619300 RepID=G3ATK7_SPAPN|nr:uncharacterized protein SPAPADRAFT_142865 [Spathaspora passalidarum NRRL Y-27907]EGW30970.1 hypothetical protein SPAPADRAFT_142865 [Spathaspora passalidarum NRRL Y-27907]